jgi:hypothetical protein
MGKGAAALAALLTAVPAAADTRRFALEVFAGSAFSFPTPVVIRQQGYPDLSFSARWETQPWTGHAPYYAWRLALEDGEGGWELQHLHHKLTLANPGAEVAHFAITHGYNLVVVNRAFALGEWRLRAGAGLVIAHPENTVRGQVLPHESGGIGGGYYLSGAALHVSAGRRFALGLGFSLNVEAAFTAAHAEVAVVEGSASVPNLALHFLFGIGYGRAF